MGTLPGASRRELCDASGEPAQAVGIGEVGRQGDLDARGGFPNPAGDLDEVGAQDVELGLAPERSLGRQAAQGVEQPVGRGVDQETELVGRRLGA